MELNVFLQLEVAQVVCPQCRDLIDPVAAEGLVAHCACGYRVAVGRAELDAALGPYYRDHSVRLEVETTETRHANPQEGNMPIGTGSAPRADDQAARRCCYGLTWHNRKTGQSRTYTCGLAIEPELLAPYRRGLGVCHRHERGLNGLLGLPESDGWPSNPHGMAHGPTRAPGGTTSWEDR